MRTSTILAAIIIAAAAQAQAATVNYTLDFQGDICVGGANPPACVGDGQWISQDYGDQSGVDIEWNARADAPLGTTNARSFEIGGLTDPAGQRFGAAWTESIPGAIIFHALDGATVGLQGFDFVRGPQNTVGHSSSYTITDLAGGWAPVTSSTVTLGPLSSQAFDFSSLNLTSSQGFVIEIGEAGFNNGNGTRFGLGIDNIRYSVTPADTSAPTPPAVPLPATGILLLAALAGLTGMRRRARA